MIIFSPENTPRLNYTLNIIFSQILKCEYSLVTSAYSINKNQTISINYSTIEIPGSLKIVPCGLLFEKNISEQKIEVKEFSGLPCFFCATSGDITFDVFSAVFYMVSRYEEYLPFESDNHGRFKAENSLAYKNNFHRLPIVELWCKMLADRLNMRLPANAFSHNLTIDIDYAWKHKNKGLLRSMGNTLKLALTGNYSTLKEKLMVLTGKLPDPADNYNYLKSIEQTLAFSIQYFILIGNHSKYDTAIPLKNKSFRSLIKSLKQGNNIGIHPSYKAYSNSVEFEKEFFSLCKVLNRKPTKSRQHFLLISFPETFRKLIHIGIREDYSMGWSSQTGFRAGISVPFPFYDLIAEKETNLLLVPFCAMDRTLKDYLNLSPEKALEELIYLCDITRSAGGQFVMLWHNDSVSNNGEWAGWKKTFEQALIYAEQN